MKRINQRLFKGSFALLMAVVTTMSLAQAPHTIQVSQWIESRHGLLGALLRE